ncbi:MAG: SCO family protein [Cyclobacteriaceae bacterium]
MSYQISTTNYQLPKINYQLSIFVFALLLLYGCNPTEKPLPVFGERTVNGTDTVYHTIADFEFLNQDSVMVTSKTFEGKIYVADFFFTTCRTICPIMKAQMVRVNEAIKEIPDVLIVSHSIDPEYDTVALLHDYANRLGAKSDKWYFLTGQPRDYVFNLAQTSYFATAMEDKSEPDGFIHSGAFLLIDKQRRIRGKYDGTREDDVSRLLEDIKKLRKEYGN